MNPESQYGWVLDSPTHLEERVSSPESARNDHVRIDLITTSHPPPLHLVSRSSAFLFGSYHWSIGATDSSNWYEDGSWRWRVRNGAFRRSLLQQFSWSSTPYVLLKNRNFLPLPVLYQLEMAQFPRNFLPNSYSTYFLWIKSSHPVVSQW